MASWRRLALQLLAVLFTLALTCRNVESHHGPLLIYKGGRRLGGNGGGGLATLLAAGAVAKLLQGHKEHHVHHVLVPVPVPGHHGGHGW